MDVFMRNLPPDLTDNGLQKQLAPLMKALHIQDWSCQKVRRKNFGNVTFLLYRDGQQFMQHYGQETSHNVMFSKPQHKARLMILDKYVYCTLNQNPVDPLLLKCLVKSAEDRRKAKDLPISAEDAKIVFQAQSLSCGIYEHIGNELCYSPEIEWSILTGTAKFVKKALILDYMGINGHMRAEIPFRIVESIVATSRPTTALILTLWEAPRFFEIHEPDLAIMMSALLRNRKTPNATKQRLTGLPNNAPPHQKVVGQALVYRVCVSQIDFYVLSNQLFQREVVSVIRRDISVLPSSTRLSLTDGLELLLQTIKDISANKTVPFEVLFQVEALARNNYLLPWTVQRLLWKIETRFKESRNFNWQNSNEQKQPISAEAVRKLISQIGFPGVETIASEFDVEEIWKYLLENEKDIQSGHYKELITERGKENLTMVHKVMVTPTGITLHGPDPEAKNRILRRFPDNTDSFIRVQFCEEDGGDLQFNSRVSNEAIYQRFKQIMMDGIAICGRVYGFLGNSHSSLRSHSAWFVAPFWNKTRLESYFTIIPDLGNFGSIQSPARCAARIGQAFTETPFAISLVYNDIALFQLPEVETSDRKHVFSDGVGTLSRAAVEAIRDSIPPKKGAATCFQIRWGGAKGMLALDDRLRGNVMNVRGSMMKFESRDTENLEICDTANKPIPLFLNRQMIKILEDMGLPAKWFLDQQNAALENLQLVTAHISNTTGFLKRQGIADLVGFPRLLRRLEMIGLDYKRDRFMRSVVETAILRELRLMKSKARIPISQGVTLFGIMDETGYLEEGEIFVAFNKAPFIGCHMMDLDNRRMLVTRSPALHPGDIQLATNIIPPTGHPLRSLRNCIVFSQKGKRDLPSCLSGGDLDGDVYSVIWDVAAIAGCQRTFSPAEYARVTPLDIGRRVEKKDMTDFFIQFMATDQLGLIATRHMILADQRAEGTMDLDCLKLAQLHSTGVDYSKTGIPVDLQELFSIKTNRYRPHFLAPSGSIYIKNRTDIAFDLPTRPREDEERDEDDNLGPQYLFYQSEKVNGVLFDAIDEQRVWYQNIKGQTRTDETIWDDLLEYIVDECRTKLPGLDWDHMHEEALEIRGAYEDAIHSAAEHYSTHPTQSLTELEVFTGSIFNPSGVQTRRQRDRSLQLKDEFERIARWIENLIRRRTVKAAGENDGDAKGPEDPLEALMFSIACFEVSQRSQKRSHRSRSGRAADEYQSFKIVSACCAIKELDAALKRADVAEWYA